MNLSASAGYQLHDFERIEPQPAPTMPGRSEFARDRARVLHSAAFRRLSAKTQVLSPDSGDYARTRLTHSLEVAQVGREFANTLGLDADLVDMACLAHDLGHPPFGHNGESALNHWASDIGGFEGNAQTFRILSRLEPKIFTADGLSRGLNLTRASLDAATKYPWPNWRSHEFINSQKFGVYLDDMETFEWMRSSAPEGAKCVEAQVMDFADDVAYSMHDFEDAIVEGYLDPAILSDAAAEKELIAGIAEWEGGMLAAVQIEEALERLRTNPNWLTSFDSSARALAQLKNLSSDLIGSFVARTTKAVLESSSSHTLVRYGSGVIVPSKVKAEIAVLKGVVAIFLMSNSKRQGFYQQQRELLHELADALWANPDQLEVLFFHRWEANDEYSSRRRVVTDQIASLTDSAARELHKRLKT